SDCRLERLELMTQAGPTVDNQKDITEPVAQRVPPCLEPSILGHRFDAVVAEDSLPRSDDLLQFGDHASDQRWVRSARNGPDMRPGLQRRQYSAAKVETVELYLVGIVGDGQRGD